MSYIDQYFSYRLWSYFRPNKLIYFMNVEMKKDWGKFKKGELFLEARISLVTEEFRVYKSVESIKNNTADDIMEIDASALIIGYEPTIANLAKMHKIFPRQT